MKRWLPWLGLGAAIVAIAGWLRHEGRPTYESLQGDTFGTRYRVSYRRGPDPQTARKAIEAELDRIDRMASTWRNDSELMRYSRSPNQADFEPSAELGQLLERAREIEAWTDGAFSMQFNPDHLDLSAIAKGHAVDRIDELLHERFRIGHCLVEIGGEIKVRGDGPSGDGWQLGIFTPGDAPPIRLTLSDNSIATSGSYFQGDHIIDPLDGDPTADDLYSVSVLHPSNATADALATALMVMGLEDAMSWAKANDIHTIILEKNGTRHEHDPQS